MIEAPARPIFAAYPHLAGHVPWVPLVDLPTPVERLATTGGWIKRDDLSHPRYGGNKMRKLEFIVGEWRRDRIRKVVTFGATGTNAGVATALLCRDEGIACEVLLFDQPDSPVARANYAAMVALGARLRHCGPLAAAYLAFRLHPDRLRGDTYFLFAGCANPPATLAYVNAAFELAAQVQRGDLPEPVEIVVAVGSSSTLAGLALGSALAGLRAHVIGVRVVPSHLFGVAACTPGTVRAHMRHAAGLLRLTRDLPAFTLDERWFGAGYGHPSVAATDASLWWREQHPVLIEGTYTGKAVACFRERLPVAAGPVLYWHTFNSRPLDGMANS